MYIYIYRWEEIEKLTCIYHIYHVSKNPSPEWFPHDFRRRGVRAVALRR